MRTPATISLLVAAFLTLPFLAQEPGTASSAKAAAAAPTLTAEGYRDLIVNTADAMSRINAYGEVTDGRERRCIMTFTLTDAATQDVADRVKTWASARPPKTLAESHAEILKWMKSAQDGAKKIGTCIEPVLQMPAEQFAFFGLLGSYGDLRKKAATALSELNVELPPLAKP